MESVLCNITADESVLYISPVLGVLCYEAQLTSNPLTHTEETISTFESFKPI